MQELDLSHNSCLVPRTLENIFHQLPKLWKLNISHCSGVTTIEPLAAIKERLVHLSLAGVMILSTSVTIGVLKKLTKLRYLDVSTVATNMDAAHEEVIGVAVFSALLQTLLFFTTHIVTLFIEY